MAPEVTFELTVGRDVVQLLPEQSGRYLYAIELGSSYIDAFRIDPITGILSLVLGSPFFADIGEAQLMQSTVRVQ